MEDYLKKSLRNGVYASIVGFFMTTSFYIWISKNYPLNANIFFIISMMAVGALYSALFYGMIVFFITMIFYHFRNRGKKKVIFLHKAGFI